MNCVKELHWWLHPPTSLSHIVESCEVAQKDQPKTEIQPIRRQKELRNIVTQEGISVECQPTACEQFWQHSEQVWTCLGGGGSRYGEVHVWDMEPGIGGDETGARWWVLYGEGPGGMTCDWPMTSQVMVIRDPVWTDRMTNR